MAYSLLNAAANPEQPETVLSYGHYCRVLTQLVTRQNPDTDRETWVLPGFEAQAAALFRNVVVNNLSQAAVKDHATLPVPNIIATFFPILFSPFPLPNQSCPADRPNAPRD
jgi:hypothetical protein